MEQRYLLIRRTRFCCSSFSFTKYADSTELKRLHNIHNRRCTPVRPRIRGFEPRKRYFGTSSTSRALSLVTGREWWSIWHKGGLVKLKKTKNRPMVRLDGIVGLYRPVVVGDIDYYGWRCGALYELVTCVSLDRPYVLYV